MTLHAIDPLAQVPQQPGHVAHEPQQPEVISGADFRRLLGWSRQKFYALVRAGRVRHLLAVNVSTQRRPYYVRAKVEAWLRETPTSGLRPSRPHFGKR